MNHMYIDIYDLRTNLLYLSLSDQIKQQYCFVVHYKSFVDDLKIIFVVYITRVGMQERMKNRYGKKKMML